jgi:hypothetical protein
MSTTMNVILALLRLLLSMQCLCHIAKSFTLSRKIGSNAGVCGSHLSPVCRLCYNQALGFTDTIHETLTYQKF